MITGPRPLGFEKFCGSEGSAMAFGSNPVPSCRTRTTSAGEDGRSCGHHATEGYRE
jgi:hypothetical protein